jgi:hypothetical protein
LKAQAIAGASIPQAAQLAADKINAKGGIDGCKVEIIVVVFAGLTGGEIGLVVPHAITIDADKTYWLALGFP